MNDLIFTASASFDRQLFWEQGASVRYLVVRLHANTTDDNNFKERAPLNIALAIDASGSMQGGKLEAAKSAALGLAARLNEQDRLTVVSFASDVHVHVDTVKVSDENLNSIRSEISLLQTRGSTNLSGGWFSAVESAARIAEEDARMAPRVILLSDGHANEGITDPVDLQEHARELMLRGVMTSTLGIGDGYDEKLLRGIAEHGGGRLHDAEFTDEISSVLIGELDDIFATLIDGAEISLSIPSGVQVQVVGKAGAAIKDNCLRVSVGPIQDGIDRIVVFKVTCPQVPRGDELHFEITAHGRNVAAQNVVDSNPVTTKLTSAGSAANNAQLRDVSIAGTVARSWSAQIVSNSAIMNLDRAYAEATQYVERELVYFRQYVNGLEHGEQMARDLEMLLHRVGRQINTRVRKEMVFQPAMALESRVDRRGLNKPSWSARLKQHE